MMKRLALLFVIGCFLSVTPFVRAQQTEPQKSKLVQFQMALLKKGPKWPATQTPESQRILHQHLVNVLALLDSGKAVLAGPLGDDTDLAGIFVLRASSAEEARTWVDADPAVKAGLFVPEMHPWFSEDIFKKRIAPLKMNMFYLAFLKSGPNRTQPAAEAEEIQKSHIANIERLAKSGKLVAAGPFGDDGALRGIFVFRVGSLEEAQSLSDTDPAVKAGRLVLEIHPWQVPEGVLP
jgi:uncharacterized protein YciI